MVSVLGALLVGCGGAAQQQFREQAVRLQSIEARAAELEAQLATQRGATDALDAALAECRGDVRAAQGVGEQAQRVASAVDTRLQDCQRREEAVRADLDLSRRTAAATEAELARVRTEWEAQRQAAAANQTRLQTALEASRSEGATLRAEMDVLLEEKARIEREKREKLAEISKTYDGLLEGMRDQVAQGRVAISNLRGQLSVKMQEEILFDSGSAVVKPEGQQLLGEIAAALQEIGERGIQVEGHTDNLPIRGVLAQRFPTNWELSVARALSVVRYLQDVAGVDPARLVAAGYGENRPAVPNDSAENRARNRRIELKLVPLPSEAGLLEEGGEPMLSPDPAGSESPSREAEPAAPPQAPLPTSPEP